MQEQNTPSSLFTSRTFRWIMYFKFFMVICIWGLVPLLIPLALLPLLGLAALVPYAIWLRLWGAVVLADFFVYWHIYRRPQSRLAGYFMVFAVLDNGGFGLVLLVVTLVHGLPWGVWANIPFQLFFGACFAWFYYKHRRLGGTISRESRRELC